MSGLFKQFPKLKYSIHDNNVFVDMINLFRFVDVNDKMAQDVLSYQYTEIVNGDRPDIVSQKLYGTPDFYWTFFIANDELKGGLDAWPLTADKLDDVVHETYAQYSTYVIYPRVSKSFDYLPYLSDPDNPNHRILTEAVIYNFFSNIDLDYAFLRVQRNGINASIESWDPNTLQLKLFKYEPGTDDQGTDDTKDDIITQTSEEAKALFLKDTGEGLKLALDVETVYDSEFATWFKTLCQWGTDILKFSGGEVYNNLPINNFNELNEIKDYEGMRSMWETYFNNVHDTLLTDKPLVEFNITDMWEEGQDAPHHYDRELISTGEQDTGTVYDYYESRKPGEETIYKFTPISYYEYEIAKNDSKSRIKYIQPKYISEFVKEYRELINQ
jgi:hypothetical protein